MLSASLGEVGDDWGCIFTLYNVRYFPVVFLSSAVEI